MEPNDFLVKNIFKRPFHNWLPPVFQIDLIQQSVLFTPGRLSPDCHRKRLPTLMPFSHCSPSLFSQRMNQLPCLLFNGCVLSEALADHCSQSQKSLPPLNSEGTHLRKHMPQTVSDFFWFVFLSSTTRS